MRHTVSPAVSQVSDPFKLGKSDWADLCRCEKVVWLAHLTPKQFFLFEKKKQNKKTIGFLFYFFVFGACFVFVGRDWLQSSPHVKSNWMWDLIRDTWKWPPRQDHLSLSPGHFAKASDFFKQISQKMFRGLWDLKYWKKLVFDFSFFFFHPLIERGAYCVLGKV